MTANIVVIFAGSWNQLWSGKDQSTDLSLQYGTGHSGTNWTQDYTVCLRANTEWETQTLFKISGLLLLTWQIVYGLCHWGASG